MNRCLSVVLYPFSQRRAMDYYLLGLLLACLLTAGCATPPAAPDIQPPIFTVTAEGEGDEVTVSVEGETAIIDVHSQSGIGQATVELVSGAPPQKIILRLHLKGLERFRLAYDQTVITAQVSSTDSGAIIQTVVSPNGDETLIASDSPFWLDSRIVSDQTPPTIPLDQGYFEIALPQDFLAAGYRAFAIRWIDFYR